MISTSRRQFLHTAGLAGASVLLGPPARVSWAAKGGTCNKLRLAFFTDSHACADWDTPMALAKAAKAINAEHPELVIAGGDLIYDGCEVSVATAELQWKVYMEMHQAIRAPVEPVFGNHDLVAVRPDDGTEPLVDPRSVFTTKFGLDRTWRVLDVEGYRIFLLDSVDTNDGDVFYKGGVSAEQLGWLKAELGRTNTDTPIVLATHIPFLSVITQATKGALTQVKAGSMVANNREVLELFSNHNLLLVLQGHHHAEEMLRFQGTTFITGGAICGNKWKGPKHGTSEGFGVLTLKHDRVDWDYKSYGWEAKRT